MNDTNEEMKAKYEFYAYKRNQMYTLFSIMLSVFGLTAVLLKDTFLNYKYFNPDFAISFTLVGGISLAFGVGLLLYRYLQTGFLQKNLTIKSSDYSLRKEIDELKMEVLKFKKKTGTLEESESLNTTINESINNILSEDFIKTKLVSAYGDKVINDSKMQRLFGVFEHLVERIEGELARLRRSANLNLVIGTLTTFIAVTALGFEVFKNELDFSDSVKLLSHYLPRLSLVIFIEIFAFFFLKLYKANLNDIKYFNNEKTNIDFKLIALITAINNENADLIKLSIEELIRTERNFVLKKDETTVEIEKLRNDSENNKLLSQLLGKLADKL